MQHPVALDDDVRVLEQVLPVDLPEVALALGRVAVIYQITSVTADRSRLVAKLAFAAPGSAARWRSQPS